MATTEIEVVNGADLPEKSGTAFEMYGFDTSTGKMVRISPERVSDYLQSRCLIPNNTIEVLTANGTADLGVKQIHGAVYSITDSVSEIIVGTCRYMALP